VSLPRTGPRPALEARALELRRDGRPVVGPLDWKVLAGERWIVMGPNGCGKSTLTQSLQGRLHPWDGHLSILGIRLGETPLQSLWKRVGFAGDTLERLVDPSTTLLEYVATASVGTVGVRFARPSPAAKTAARRELDFWGLTDLVDRPLSQTSLGQRRKAHIARALAPEPELLVLDEPFAGLDPVARHDLLRRVEDWSREHRDLPVVLVTHHVEEIPGTATHLLLLGPDGRSVSQGPLRRTLRSADLSRAFGRTLRLAGRPGHWSLQIAGTGSSRDSVS